MIPDTWESFQKKSTSLALRLKRNGGLMAQGTIRTGTSEVKSTRRSGSDFCQFLFAIGSISPTNTTPVHVSASLNL